MICDGCKHYSKDKKTSNGKADPCLLKGSSGWQHWILYQSPPEKCVMNRTKEEKNESN